MPTLRFGKVWQVICHFGVLFFCNLGTSKTDIKIRHHGKYCYPISFPIYMVTPTMFPWDKKTWAHKCINSLVSHKLSHHCSVFFFWADAAIWWCLRTGGGGVVHNKAQWVFPQQGKVIEAEGILGTFFQTRLFSPGFHRLLYCHCCQCSESK